eukprot:scaffold3238_cov91-Cylindrotheca_fusiformis.AAC.1
METCDANSTNVIWQESKSGQRGRSRRVSYQTPVKRFETFGMTNCVCVQVRESQVYSLGINPSNYRSVPCRALGLGCFVKNDNVRMNSKCTAWYCQQKPRR